MPTVEELENSPLLEIVGGEISGQRTFKVAWADRLEAVRALWGSLQVIEGVPTYTPPAHYPDFPNVLVNELRIEPLDRNSPLGLTPLVDFSSGTNEFEFARITARYKNFEMGTDGGRKPTVPNGTILSYSSDLASEYLPVPGRTWRWNMTGNPQVSDDLSPGVLIPCEDIHFAWRRVPLPPWDAIRDLRGQVNADTFLGHAAGTMLFLGARVQHDFQVTDTGLWRIDYHFKVKELRSTADSTLRLGWNHYYRPQADAGEHWLSIQDAEGNFPYPAGDFASLFVFGS